MFVVTDRAQVFGELSCEVLTIQQGAILASGLSAPQIGGHLLRRFWKHIESIEQVVRASDHFCTRCCIEPDHIDLPTSGHAPRLYLLDARGLAPTHSHSSYFLHGVSLALHAEKTIGCIPRDDLEQIVTAGLG